MQLNSDILNKVTYLVGNPEIAAKLPEISAMPPFDDMIVAFLDDLSKELIHTKDAKAYSDVITLGFWLRKASILKLKERFGNKEGYRLGKGVVFHIAPSNVPVNFAYSLFTGLLCGNANVVRVPSKEFPQVRIIIEAIKKVLEQHRKLAPYIICVRYERNKDVNDLFSSYSDMRVVWGGDKTIEELRKSPLPPRSGEITFADRYSIAIIDSDSYMSIENKKKTAEDFYNDTFFSDQNACTSPRMVIWTGSRKDEAKKVFWEEEHALVEKKYSFQPIQAVNKLTRSFLAASAISGVKVEPHSDNLIVRVTVPKVTGELMDYRDNSGYFYEYDCEDIMEIALLCNDKRCQTVTYIGDRNVILPLLQAGVKGVDRVVPIGKTMDFDLVWDGYDLVENLTRGIARI